LQSSFRDCSAEEGAAVCAEQCSSARPTQWNFTEDFVTRSSCKGDPIYSTAAEQIAGTDMAFERTNFTWNSADSTAAFTIENTRDAIVQFCQLDTCEGMNCICFLRHMGSELVRCLGFRQNTCEDGDFEWKGMFCVIDSWTIADSVFDDNMFIWIVGQIAMDRTFTLTFRNCYFDAVALSCQGGALVELDDCEVGAETLPSWGQCPNRTPRKSMSRRRSPVESMSPSMSATVKAEVGLSPALGGAIAGVIGALVLLGIVVRCVCQRWRTDEFEERDSRRTIIQLEMMDQDQADVGARWCDEGIPDAPPATQFPYVVGPRSCPSYPEDPPSYGDAPPPYDHAVAPPPFYPGTFPGLGVGDQRP
jgi:hypothetical protein